jgi:hypothetical protein
MLFFLGMIAVLIWWQDKQVKALSEMTREQTKVSLGQLEVLNKTINLLASADPMTYQAIAAMEVTSSSNTGDEYVPQDDISEFHRHLGLSGQEDDSNSDWSQYEPAVHGDFDFDLSTKQ